MVPQRRLQFTEHDQGLVNRLELPPGPEASPHVQVLEEDLRIVTSDPFDVVGANHRGGGRNPGRLEDGEEDVPNTLGARFPPVELAEPLG